MAPADVVVVAGMRDLTVDELVRLVRMLHDENERLRADARHALVQSCESIELGSEIDHLDTPASQLTSRGEARRENPSSSEHDP